jgi:hypothetical protein
VEADDDAHEALAAEGDEDARSDDRDYTVDSVGEGLVERDGQGYIAEGGHLPLRVKVFEGEGIGTRE